MYVIDIDPDATGAWSHIYYQGDEDRVAYDVECRLSMGDSGTLKLTVPHSNPLAASVTTRKSLLDFKRDGKSLGIFEVREKSRDMMGNMEVYAVGELAWLFDSVQPQAEFHDVTPRLFLTALVNVHNAQCPEHQFRVGTVDVTDPNDSLYRYTNREQTLDAIRDKLVDRLGGQIKLRRVNGVRYIDYLTEATYGSEAQQTVRFGENILDYSDNFTVDDICSEVVPLGARLENDAADNSTIGNLDKRVTIEGVNGGSDTVSSPDLVRRYGHVRTTHIWEDVTVPSNLKKRAEDWLRDGQFERMHVSVRAVDLSMADDQFGELRMGDFAYVVAEPLGLRRRFQITSRTYHPDDPTQDEVELGDDELLSFVASNVRRGSSTSAALADSEYQQTQWLADAIGNVTAMMTGDRGGYKYTEYDEDGRWLADYYMDSADKSTAKVVHKVNMNGDAYSTNGVGGPYETAIMANGIILGKYIQAHSVTAEKIAVDYTKTWQDADTKTLNTARTEFKAADNQIIARVSKVETAASGLRTDLSAEIKVRADQISQTVKRGQINSTIKQTAETIYIESNKFGWKSTYSSLTTDGKLTAKNATFDDCTVSGDFETVYGNYKATMHAAQVQFYARSSASSNWVQTALINGYSPPNFPLLQLVASKNISRAYSTNGSQTSKIQVAPDAVKLMTGHGNTDSASIVATNDGYIELTSRNMNLYASQGRVRVVSNLNVEGTVSITGSLYVNGRRIE